MSNYKYFGTYNGPSYGGPDRDYLMGFRSLADAKRAFLSFQSGHVVYDEFYENPAGFYVPWNLGLWVRTSGTTESDYMDLYAGEKRDEGQYIISDSIQYRLTLGVRGGVVVK